MAGILQLYYIGFLIVDIEFLLGHIYKALRETLIHGGLFIYWGASGCQIRVDVSSMYGGGGEGG